jgi:NADH dehydrogenase
MAHLFTVFGGTGFLGSRIVRRLLDDGHQVRIAARNPDEFASELGSDRAEPVRADILDPSTLDAALQGAEGVVNAVSLYKESGKATFDAVHVDGAARLARRAESADVKRFVQISGIGSDPTAVDPYVQARGRGENAVRGAFSSASIIRPSAMFGQGDALLSTILGTARRLPVFPLFGSGEVRLQPVYVDDVAQAIARLLVADDPAQTYEFGGARAYSYRDLVRKVAAAAGLTVWTLPVPLVIWRGIAAAGSVVPGIPLTPGQVALVSKDNVVTETEPGLRELLVIPQDIVDFVQQNLRFDSR